MIYRVMLPLLLIVFVLMGLWVSFLHFPCNWVMYVVMGLEMLVATVVMAMEYQAQHVGGASGWRKWAGAALVFLASVSIWPFYWASSVC